MRNAAGSSRSGEVAVVFGSSQAAVALLLIVHLRIDLLILSWFADAAEVGQFAVAFGVSQPLADRGLAIGLVLIPGTVVTTTNDAAAGYEQTANALRAAVGLALAGAVLLGLVAPPLVEIVFGSSFSPAVAPLRILLPGAVAFAAILVLQSDLAGRGRIWEVAGIQVIAVAANAALALALIPQFGAEGAAAASSASHALAAISLLVLFRRATSRARGRRSAPVAFDEAGIGIT